MTKKRNEYTKAYRLGAVKLVTEQGCSYAEAGRSLGINANLISRWHRELKALDQDAFPGQGHLAPDQEEIRRLRDKIKRLELERDILKKATAFFAKEST